MVQPGTNGERARRVTRLLIRRRSRARQWLGLGLIAPRRDVDGRTAITTNAPITALDSREAPSNLITGQAKDWHRASGRLRGECPADHRQTLDD